MMNKMLKIKGLAVIALSMILMSPMPAFAYKLLEPLPGLNNVNVTLSSYLKWLFPFTLTVVAILAVLMIVVGGLELVGGGSEGLKTSGKKKIEGAVYGLLLAISAYLILNTINPNLVNMNLDIKPVTIENDSAGVSISTGPTCRIEYKNIGISKVYSISNFASDSGGCVVVCNNIVVGFSRNPAITDIVPDPNNCSN